MIFPSDREIGRAEISQVVGRTENTMSPFDLHMTMDFGNAEACNTF